MKLYPLLFEVLESRETANLQICRKVMANLLKRKLAPVPFSGSVTEARSVAASLRTRNTPPAIWLINTYWAEEMLPELDLLIGPTPAIFFKRELFGAGMSTQMPAVGAPDKLNSILEKLSPRLTVIWGFGGASVDSLAVKVSDALANYLTDGNFQHIEQAAPGHNSVARAMTSANANLQAFRAQIEMLPPKSSSSAASVLASSTGAAPAVKAATTASAPAVKDGDSVRPRSKPLAPARRGVNGNIEQLGLSTLLMMMEMEKKTGELVLNRDNVQAILRIKGGRIVEASARGGGVQPEASSGPECVFHLLTWQTGVFEFFLRDVLCEDSIQSTTTSLLMEGARRMDEGGNTDEPGTGILG